MTENDDPRNDEENLRNMTTRKDWLATDERSNAKKKAKRPLADPNAPLPSSSGESEAIQSLTLVPTLECSESPQEIYLHLRSIFGNEHQSTNQFTDASLQPTTTAHLEEFARFDRIDGARTDSSQWLNHLYDGTNNTGVETSSSDLGSVNQLAYSKYT